MAINVGVICEGSHDFNVLREFIAAILIETENELGRIDCLQPQVSATFQTTGGGWGRVKGWCEQSNGEFYRTFIDKPLLGNSITYDILIIHLDGDVVGICKAAPLTGLDIEEMPIDDVIQSLKKAILKEWLNIDGEHIAKIVACTPVRHLESWLIAALSPLITNPETRAMKSEFRNGPAKQYDGKLREKYIMAATDAIIASANIRKSCISYVEFENDLSKSVKLQRRFNT